MSDGTHQQEWRAKRDGWVLSAVGVSVACLLFAIVAGSLALRAGSVAQQPATSNEPKAAPVQPMKTVQIEVGEMFIKPNRIEVAQGTPIKFEVVNKGTQLHDFQVNGKKTPLIDPGKSATLETEPLQKSTVAVCTVAGHEAAGMNMTIKVSGSAVPGGESATAATSSNHSGTHGSTSPAAADGPKVDPTAKPGPDWKARDPKLAPAPAPAGTVHKVTFDMGETVLEVAPGVKQELWTFNGMAPGPTLHGKVGDTFEVTIVNKGKVSHSIDFHASQTPMDTDMRTLKPGESLTYTFTATHSGSWMYHCGTAPAVHHIGNGMHGQVVIDPPNLAKVDHEFTLVQSEFYFGPDGQPGDLAKMKADKWDVVAFNGYHALYNHAPIRVEPGQRVRIWVQNNGPSENSAFHIVGMQFDTVFKEGAYTLRPNNPEKGGAQALDLQPSQGGFVEFTVPPRGTYVFVSHKFSNVDKGAVGTIHAGEPVASHNGGGGH